MSRLARHVALEHLVGRRVVQVVLRLVADVDRHEPFSVVRIVVEIRGIGRSVVVVGLEQVESQDACRRW